MTPEFDPVPFAILSVGALWAIIAGLYAYHQTCIIRRGFKKCCQHSVFFNRLWEHGRFDKSLWYQGRASRCCWCGRLTSNFSIWEFDPKSTPIFETEQEAIDASRALGT